MSLVWAWASVLVQHITGDLEFNQPFVISYMGSSLFVSYFPMHYAFVACGWARNPPWRDSG